MPDFLLEIGCEEIPARMIGAAEAELAKRVRDLFAREGLSQAIGDDNHRAGADAASLQAFSTPRRLGLLIQGVSQKQADVEEQLQGPATKIAFKDGKPTAAAEAFAKKAGVSVSKLEKVSTAKGEYLSARVLRKGRDAGEILAEMLPKEIAGLYWPKNMYWRAGAPEHFVRPVRWIVAMLDGEVIPLEFAGVKAGSVSRGHRFFTEGVKIANVLSYAKGLEKAKVIADPHEREQRIRKALDAATRVIPGARCRDDDNLLNTVVNLTEWPSVILGSFDREYLALPEEVLVTVMRDHQKYFAVEDASGKLAPHFLAVLNTDGDPDGLIRHGNERVLRARFNDAQFFWQTDQQVPLKQRVGLLKSVTFQKDLGSYYEKTLRVEKLAGHLAKDLHDAGAKIDLAALAQAAQLCKTDLTTELVKEFTELQGVVGGLYARAQGQDEAVAQAIYDHYKPESMDDAIPRTLEGALLSIADKADSIAGMFALGLQPTGSKDPFALRRQANGIVRIIAEHKLRIDIHAIFKLALTQFENNLRGKTTTSVDGLMYLFFRERLEFYLRNVLGLAYDTVGAVLAPGGMDLLDIIARAEAVTRVRESEDFQHIAIAFKRTKNILSQARDQGKEIGHGIMTDSLPEETEKELARRVPEIHASVEKLRGIKDYDKALFEISTLRPLVDTFFDRVMVMVDDRKIRSARLGLLAELLRNFSAIADFSEIVTEGKR